MRMRILITKDYEELSAKTADLIAAQVLLRPDCVLGLATGSTPVGAYRDLVEKYENGEIDFSDVKTVNLDEYCGMRDSDPQSYHYFMNENLFSRINIRPENTHLPDGTASDVSRECESYEKLIASLGRIDLLLLGIGNNGHIGFNEPSEGFAVKTHCVDLTDDTVRANKRFFSNESEVPRKALTMGIGTIMMAETILLAASGASKAEALKKALRGPVTPEVPASILQLHPNVIVVADEAAFG